MLEFKRMRFARRGRSTFGVCVCRICFLYCVRWSQTDLGSGFRGFVRPLKNVPVHFSSCSFLTTVTPQKVTRENKKYLLKIKKGSRTTLLDHLIRFLFSFFALFACAKRKVRCGLLLRPF